MTAKTHLFLFTNEYPCSEALEHYIGHEISFLSNAFEKVIIVPSSPGTIKRKIPANVDVIDLYDKKWFKGSKSDMIKCLPLFLKFYPGELKGKSIKLSFSKLLREFKSFYNAYISGNAILNYMRLNNIEVRAGAFYSYWFYHAPLICGILKSRKKIEHFYSRAHQADLYTEQFPGNDSFYNFKARQVTKMLPADSISQAYLQKRFPQWKEKFVVSHVAVSDNGLNTAPENELVVVTCSSYSPRKRIDLIADLIANYTKPLKWIHFGHIPTEILKGYSIKYAGSENIRSASFRGDVSNEELMNFYKRTPVSVIVNASTSEGLPVSVIEASSFGIPAIATNSNGMPDIVTPQNGFLLPVNFLANEFYACIEKIRNAGETLRKGARELFLREFNAERNYPELIKLIKQ